MKRNRAEYMREYRKRKAAEKLEASDKRRREMNLVGDSIPSVSSSTTLPSISVNAAVPTRTEPPLIGVQVTADFQGMHRVGPPYVGYARNNNAHLEFERKFTKNNFGATCMVCDRLWYDSDLKKPPACSRDTLRAEFPAMDIEAALVCSTCHLSLNKNKIPLLSKSNGFAYPLRPADLPVLDLITKRLISPRLPFMTIRRLRHGNGQYGILGQVINVPVSVNNMVTTLPRELDDDYAINKSNYLTGFVRKRDVKTWLEYLIEEELYKYYDIKVNGSFFSGEEQPIAQITSDEFSESIPIEESLVAQQQTLMWNEEMYLRIAPGENNIPKSILFDEHCEELAFPSIYLGRFRTFKENIRVTPFMMATSELRRADRRGVTPTHILYMAMKIMRIRTRDSLQIAFKFIGIDSTVTRAQIGSPDYINGCIENNLAFLRHILNSAYYWASRKRDLFAMIRQLGKPTFFLTMSANEIGWPKLMKLLYKLKNDGADIDDDALRELHYNMKATLINEDPVTCAIHFNKLVDIVMRILQSKRFSPFGKNYVTHFFKRIEFQHRGSPHAHILLWLNDAPGNAVGADMSEAVNLIDCIVSVSAENASGHVKLQQHKHTFTCY